MQSPGKTSATVVVAIVVVVDWVDTVDPDESVELVDTLVETVDARKINVIKIKGNMLLDHC